MWGTNFLALVAKFEIWWICCLFYRADPGTYRMRMCCLSDDKLQGYLRSSYDRQDIDICETINTIMGNMLQENANKERCLYICTQGHID